MMKCVVKQMFSAGAGRTEKFLSADREVICNHILLATVTHFRMNPTLIPYHHRTMPKLAVKSDQAKARTRHIIYYKPSV